MTLPLIQPDPIFEREREREREREGERDSIRTITLSISKFRRVYIFVRKILTKNSKCHYVD